MAVPDDRAMVLAAGDRLGPYEILAPLGAGGFDELARRVPAGAH